MESAKELLINRLQTMDKELTPDDRKEAERALDLSRVTIDKYLGGDVPNVDLGIKIYEFFAGRIKEKIEKIKAIA